MPAVVVPPFTKSQFTHSPFIHGGGIGKGFSKVAEATSTGTNITGPATIQAGDLLVLWDRAIAGTLPAAATPSGFSSAATADNGTTIRAILSSKVADGSEANASLTGMAGLAVDKVLLVFRRDVPISTATAGSPAGQVTDANPSAQVVGASAGTPPLVVLAGYAATSVAIDPRSFSPAKDGEATSGTDCFLAWKIYKSAPADVTVDMDDEGNGNCLVSVYLACS